MELILSGEGGLVWIKNREDSTIIIYTILKEGGKSMRTAIIKRIIMPYTQQAVLLHLTAMVFLLALLTDLMAAEILFLGLFAKRRGFLM